MAVVEWGKTYCGRGHRHLGGQMSLHWTPCSCEAAIGGGHHAVKCRIPDADGVECGDWTVPGCVDPSKRKHWSPG
jgi:hypothetical protein